MALGDSSELMSSGIRDIHYRTASHQHEELASRTDVATGESSWRHPGVQPEVSSMLVPKHGDGNEMVKQADPQEKKRHLQDANGDVTVHSLRERIQIQSGRQQKGEQSATVNPRFHQRAA